jgi:hypothetical protein
MHLALKCCANSRTTLPYGALGMRSSVDFWYRLISLRAIVPCRHLRAFLSPHNVKALLRIAVVTIARTGGLPPVDLRAVCLVLRTRRL